VGAGADKATIATRAMTKAQSFDISFNSPRGLERCERTLITWSKKGNAHCAGFLSVARWIDAILARCSSIAAANSIGVPPRGAVPTAIARARKAGPAGLGARAGASPPLRVGGRARPPQQGRRARA